jgi:urea transport system substrate-binding protein
VKRTPISSGIQSILLTLWLSFAVSTVDAAEDTIKVGILHSLTGTMAVSESVLKDTVLMLIADQNKKGGLLGKKLEPIVVDPASDWDAYAEKAGELLTSEKVAVVFGCWTSISRKAVLPVFEQLNGLLFYPFNMRARRARATFSTWVPRPTSRPFRRSATS